MDFEAVFKSLPTPTMVMDARFDIVAANEAYLNVTGRRREDLIGAHVFDAFPAEEAGRTALLSSFERVRDHGVADMIPVLDYPIAGAEGIEPRRWSCSHTPLFDADGKVAHIVQTTMDISNIGSPRPAGGVIEPAGAAEPASPPERFEMIRLLNHTLLATAHHLRRVFMKASNFMCVLRGPELVYEFANQSYLDLIGGRDPLGRRLRDVLPELEGQGYFEVIEHVHASGEAFAGRKLRVMLDDATGRPQEYFVDVTCQPMRDESGAVTGVFVEGADTTEIALAEQRQALLIRELHHRVRNTLATVQGVMNTTARTSATIEEFQEAFAGRIASLAKTHAIMTDELDQCVSFAHLLRQELDVYGGDGVRVRLDGPNVELASQIAVPLGMAVHELTTNAVKYGALAGEAGRVDVEWGLSRDTTGSALRWEWRETGGPKVDPPGREGFGSMLLKRVLSQQIGAEVNVVYEPEGFRLRMLVPLRAAR
ncbi:sensor histidine kinase [Methylocella sp.]|uniref:sensor histidine kinase n=1 Tax=Methylocella sp. TaxID=1978226 RepID=UPI003784A316